MTQQPSAAGMHQPTQHRANSDAVAGQVAPAVGALARIVLGAQPPGAVMQQVAGLARQIVPGADEVSITVIDRGQRVTVWFAGDLATVLDERQFPAGRGPCVDAAGTGHTITIDDTADDRLYPEFSRQAHQHGIRHVLAVAMPDPQGTRAALGIYGNGDAGPFTPETFDIAARFTEHATVTVANAALYTDALEEIAQMKTAMASRAVIEQAKGMIMRDHRCDAAEAFTLLVDLSTRTNRTVHDVAESLTDTSAAPGPPDSRSPRAAGPDLQSAAMDLVDGFDDPDMAALARLTPAARAEQRRARTTLFIYTEQLWVHATAEGLQPGPRPGLYAVSALRNLMDALCGHVDEAQQAAGDGSHDQ
jgi:ANTAR domain